MIIATYKMELGNFHNFSLDIDFFKLTILSTCLFLYEIDY